MVLEQQEWLLHSTLIVLIVYAYITTRYLTLTLVPQRAYNFAEIFRFNADSAPQGPAINHCFSTVQRLIQADKKKIYLYGKTDLHTSKFSVHNSFYCSILRILYIL